MVEFLEQDGGAPWVLHDLKVPFFIAGCKALGLISKLITAPVWNLIEDPSFHILDMNNCYLQLVTFLKDISNGNLEIFVTGKVRPFPDAGVKEDVMFKALIKEAEYDADCQVILEAFFPALAKLTQKLFELSSKDVQHAAKGTAKHNKYCEQSLHFMTSFFVPNHTSRPFLQRQV